MGLEASARHLVQIKPIIASHQVRRLRTPLPLLTLSLGSSRSAAPCRKSLVR